MNELIKVTNSNGRKTLSARELYLGLGLNQAHWSRWSKGNIETNEFFFKNIDWVGFTTMVNGNEVQDYEITIEFAKHITMMARTEKSHAYRSYLSKCEEEIKQSFLLPNNYKEALLQLVEQVEANEKLLIENYEMKPKADFYDDVVDSKDAIEVGEVAKVLNCGIGRNRLFEFLRDNGVLMQNNTPYQSYVDRGWFRLVESKYTKPNGDIHINIKTVVFQKGVDGIRKLLKG